MDGLVSTFALIAGVAGAGTAGRTVALAGFAGLVAGAFSMATGEYTSVATQTELTRARSPSSAPSWTPAAEAELQELTELYQSRGLDAELARQVAEQLSRDPEQAWRVHAREELGVDPDALPSPWIAAGSSFGGFAVGGLLPLLPYLLGADSLPAAAVLAGAGLFAAGALTARFTARPGSTRVCGSCSSVSPQLR